MDVLIYGAGLLGRQVHYYVDTHFDEKLKTLGFIDDAKQKGALVVDGLRNLGSLEEVYRDGKYSPERVKLVFAIGYSDMQARQKAFSRAKEKQYQFECIVHPGARIEGDVRLGEGVIVLSGAIVDQHVQVKEITFLDTGTIICENCRIGRNNFIAAGTTIAGNTRIGDNNFIGLDTTIVNGVSIGNSNSINAKSLIHKNLGDKKRVVELHEQHLLQGN